MLVLSWVAIPEAHPSPRFCVVCGAERTGHLQGFTYMPKFTYWESLTPVPPNLIGAVEPLSLNIYIILHSRVKVKQQWTVLEVPPSL